ncbi:MAG TPA: hypothetical protein VF701_11060 [Thermoanaerobaculia bacterium]
MIPKLPRFALLVFFVAALLPTMADATVLRPIEFDEKVGNAASIVVGRVIAQRSEWDAGKEWILTYSTLRIEKTLKGLPAQEITIVTPGGKVGSIVQEVIGVPRFQQGREHVVFVRNSEAGPTVLHFQQGAYDVVTDARGVRTIQPVTPSGVKMDTQRGMAVEFERPRSLDAFEAEVRETVKRREAIRMELIEQQRKRETSIWTHIERNKLLVALALLGAILATWHFVRRG